MKDELFDDEIRKILDDASSPPPQQTWAHIMAKRKQNRRRLFFIWLMVSTSATIFCIYCFDLNFMQTLYKSPSASKVSNHTAIRTARNMFNNEISIASALNKKVGDNLYPTNKTDLLNNEAYHHRYRTLTTAFNSKKQNNSKSIASNNQHNEVSNSLILNDLLFLKPIYNLNRNDEVKQLCMRDELVTEFSIATTTIDKLFFEASIGLAAPFSLLRSTDSLSAVFIERRKQAGNFVLQKNLQLRMGYNYKGYIIKTGITLQQWTEKFDLEWKNQYRIFDRIDTVTYAILQPFTPPYYINKLDSVFIQTDTLFNVHHNLNFRSLVIPFEFGYQWQKGQLVYAVQAGIACQWFKANGTIGLPVYPFEDSERNLKYIRSQVNLNISIGAMVGYNLNEYVMLTLQPQLSYSSGNTAPTAFYKQHIITTGMQAGIRYTPFISLKKQRYNTINPLIVNK